MICNKCGRENPDDAMLCVECGHKLQSGRAAGPVDGGVVPPLPLLTDRPPLDPKRAARLREAWIVGCVTAAGSLGFALAEMAWPLWLLAGLAAAWAWLRGIPWRD